MSQCSYHRGGNKKYVLDSNYHDILHFGPNESITLNYVWFFKNGRICINEGYEWDGPSGPTFDTDNFMDGSLVHDVLYQLMREGHLARYPYRKKADKELVIQCKKDGMTFLRRWYVWLGVRLGGHNAAGGRYPWQTQITKAQDT